jgi:23S rRNA (uracil1939-C5)-methyltransferase
MAQLEIIAMTFGPFAVGRLEGKTVMVPNCAPGDLAEVEIVDERRDYAVARLKAVIRPGPDRRVPPCPYLPRCGGCDWQQIAYPAQVRFKAEIIAAEIGRALGVQLDPANLVVPAPAEFGYRSRIRLKVGPGGRLGYHQLGSNELVEIDRCLVAADALRLPTRLAAALSRERRGTLREIEVAGDGARLVAVAHLSRPPRAEEIRLAREAIDAGEAAGVVLRAERAREVIGDAAIAIEIESGLEIKIDADLFSQINHAQNRRLVGFVMEAAEICAGRRMLDLFCGAGNFSLPAARRGAEVIGVDAEPLAVAAAAANAGRLGLATARFSAMRAAETADFLLRARYRPEVIVLDPPRAGAPALIDPIARMRAQCVIYVSCDLTTLARDLRALARRGYRLAQLRAFDFFPNTHHAEIVARAVLT